MTEKVLLVAGITTLAMLSPGPDMVLVMRNTLTRDRRSGGLTALGVLTGNMFHIAYCTLGIALLLARSPVAYKVLRVASAVYLIFSQLITPDMSFAQAGLLVAVMVSVSVVFWIVFVQTLHLPVIRAGLHDSEVAIDRVFGVVLILVGAQVAMLR